MASLPNNWFACRQIVSTKSLPHHSPLQTRGSPLLLSFSDFLLPCPVILLTVLGDKRSMNPPPVLLFTLAPVLNVLIIVLIVDVSRFRLVAIFLQTFLDLDLAVDQRLPCLNSILSCPHFEEWLIDIDLCVMTVNRKSF